MKFVRAALLSLALLAIPATGFAQGGNDQIGIAGTVHLGPSLAFGGGGGAQAAFHLDLYPGYEVIDNLDVELNLGFRTFKNSGFGFTNRTTAIPALVPGARYHFDLGGAVRPYVHGHLGLGFIRTKSSGSTPFGSFTGSSSTTSFVLNYGGGVNYQINEMVGVGGGLTLRHHFSGGTLNYLDFNVGATFHF